MLSDSTSPSLRPLAPASRAPTADLWGPDEGDSHVRSCESGRVRFPPATHQSRSLGSARGAARKGGPYRE